MSERLIDEETCSVNINGWMSAEFSGADLTIDWKVNAYGDIDFV